MRTRGGPEQKIWRFQGIKSDGDEEERDQTEVKDIFFFIN